jgi:hypothetical protein
MSRWFPSGRATFIKPEAGYQSDQELVALRLTLGHTYTVAREEIGDMWSSVELVEHPGVWFNTVHFEDGK